jgi:hypothetical protein
MAVEEIKDNSCADYLGYCDSKWLLPTAKTLNVYFPTLDKYFNDLEKDEIDANLDVLLFLTRLGKAILNLVKKRREGKCVPATRHLVGLAGYARAGKDTLADYLVAQKGFVKVSFAENLREFARAVDPFLSKDIKESYAELISSLGYEEAKKLPQVRLFLINIGESMRNIIDPKIWIKTISLSAPKIVVSDVRYPNEAKFLQKLGGVVIKIVRKDNQPAHETERISVENLECDHMIFNDSTIEAMTSTLDVLLKFE